jgi:uncharacterized repeat protein (TIGR01451 family)
MKPKSLPPKTNSTDTNIATRLIQMPGAALFLRVGAVLVLAGLLASGVYWSAAVSASNKLKQRPQEPTVARSETTSPSALAKLTGSPLVKSWSYSSLFTPLPPAPPTVTTYAVDCSTAKTLYNLQDTDTVVCAKVTDADPGWLVIWSNAKFISVQNAPVGSGTSTFTLGPSSSLGDWRVILYDPFGDSVQGVSIFTVLDAANPSADLGVSKSAILDAISAGSQATFGIQVTNFGPSDATNVQITDSIPANTTFSSFALVSGPVGTNCVLPEVGASSGDTICTIPTMARGETALFAAAYDVVGGTLVSNTATAFSVANPPTPATPDPNTDSNSSTAEIRVTGATSETCTLDCPANVVVTADTTSGGEPGAFVSFAAASGSGNCGAVSNNPASGSFFTVGTHAIFSTAELGGTCSFTVTVLDTNPPTISCPANITGTAPTGETQFTLPSGPGTPTINASGGGTVTGVRSDDTPAYIDGNGDPVPAVVHALTDPYPLGTTGILWTVTDAGGRKASCTQTITILAAGDRDPVSITCPAPVNVEAPAGSCQATVSGATIGTPTTNPSDSDVVVTSQRSDGLPLTDPFPVGTTTITWTATDNLTGNQASCGQNVTVTVTSSGDTTPPTLVVPPDVSVTTSSCTATLDDELGTAEASDPAGTCNGAVTITRIGVPANFVFPTGTTTILYTATDAAGNTATGLQLVTVTESPAVPPTITAPADVSANTGPGATICGTVVSDATLGTAIANDNCPGVTVTRTGVPAGNVFPVGNTTVTYKATDASGNFVTDTQIVTVVDNTVPTVSCPTNIVVSNDPGLCSAVVTFSVTAADNCPGVTVATDIASGSTFAKGVTTVNATATDAAGNIATCSFTVTVNDTENPVISCPSSITLEPTCPTGAIATYTAPVGTDNCPGATTARTAGGASGTVFPIGTTTVTHTVTDASGNTASCSFTVTVLTPQAVIENLITSVNASSLTGTQKNGLLAKLNAALSAINGGQQNVACNKLSEFVNNVGNLISQGSLTEAQGNAWISSANHVRNTIGCTNLGCS